MTKDEILKVAKPILFNTESVRAILREKNPKTQTRRVIKPHNMAKAKKCDYDIGSGFWIDNYDFPNTKIGTPQYVKDYSVSSSWIRYTDYLENYAPYKVGDYLYIKETWKEVCDGCIGLGAPSCDECGSYWEKYEYKADDTSPETEKWRSSVHMPKEAARIFLRVTDVRVERLQDITEKDANAEGYETYFYEDGSIQEPAVVGFYEEWNSSIPKHPNKFKRYLYYWDDNPWVYVITFERVPVK